ncbi:zinc finger protein, partial [Aphelenchoides avenae]
MLQVKSEPVDLPFADSPQYKCDVCSRPAKMKRYGAIACLACAVFFRRCAFGSSSPMSCTCHDKGSHTCRYCRLRRCFKAGMRVEAIQRRDAIGPRKKRAPSSDECPPDPEMPQTQDFHVKEEIQEEYEDRKHSSGHLEQSGFIQHFLGLQDLQRLSSPTSYGHSPFFG